MRFFRGKQLENEVTEKPASKSQFLEAQKETRSRVEHLQKRIESMESESRSSAVEFQEVISSLLVSRGELIEIDVLILAELMNGRMGPRVAQIHKDFGEVIREEIQTLESRMRRSLIDCGYDFHEAKNLWQSSFDFARSISPEKVQFLERRKSPWGVITEESWT